MALPSVREIISDGNLNLVAGNSENAIVKLGVCTSGEVGVLAAYGTQSSMTSALGLGSLSENLAYQLSIAGGPVLAMPLEPSIAGSRGSVTHTGSGSGTMTSSSAPHESVLLHINGTGALGVGTFQYAVGSDGYSASITIPAGGTYRVPGTYCVATFAAGTYTSGDGYTISTAGVATGSGSGGSPAISSASSPIDNYEILVTVTLAGAVGTAQATYSLDNGVSTSPPFVTSTAYVIPNSGMVLAFSGTFTLGDTYSLKTCGPSFSNTDVANAFTALGSTYLSAGFSMLSIVQGGAQASAALAAASVAAVQTSCESLFNSGVDVRCISECPTVGSIATVSSTLTVDSADTDSALLTAFINTAAARVAVCAGDCILASPLTGLSLRRNASWGVSARLASVSPSTDGGWVQLGGVSGVSSLKRDEFQTEGLDAARFTTLRTLIGAPGFFITNIKMMAALGSDFAYMTNCRVIDKAALLARNWALPLINSKIPITQNPNAVQGSIAAGAAKKLDAALTSILSNGLVFSSPQDAVAARGQVDTNHNVLSDGILPITVAVVPFAYSRQIVITIGLAVAI